MAFRYAAVSTPTSFSRSTAAHKGRNRANAGSGCVRVRAFAQSQPPRIPPARGTWQPRSVAAQRHAARCQPARDLPLRGSALSHSRRHAA